MKKIFADKEFYKKLLIVSMPIVVQQLLTASLQLVDNFFVGSLNDYAVGSVSIINQLYFVIYLLTFGAMGGAGIFVSQYFGSKNYDKLKESFRFKLIVGFILAIFSFVLFSFFGNFFIGLFTKTGETTVLANNYLSVMRWSLFPWVVSVAISTTFREIGITKDLLKISFFAVITNTVLNYILIFGHFGFPAMGVTGAAIATLISRFVEVGLYFLLMIKKGEHFRVRFYTLFKIEKTVLKAIIVMAIPLTINEFFWSMGQTIFLQAYSTRGDYALSAMNITGAISQIVFVTIGGISTGVSVMVGKVLGENRLEEAKKNAIKIMYFAVALAISLGFVLFILSFFITDIYNVSETTKAIVKFSIRVNAVFIMIMALNVTIYFTLRSGGDTKSTIMMDSGFVWVIQVPIVFLLSRLTQIPVIYLFLTVTALEIPKLLFGITRFRKEYWVRNLATHNIYNAEILAIESNINQI